MDVNKKVEFIKDKINEIDATFNFWWLKKLKQPYLKN